MATYMKENWFGGISEDDAIARPSQYLYSENIDVTSKSNYIQLTSKPTKYIYTSKSVNALLEIKDRISNSIVIASFCDDGVIHIDSDTPAYSNARLGDLGDYPVFILGDYVYFVNSTGTSTAFKLNRTTITDAISGTWSPTLAYKDLALNNYYEHTGVLVTANLAFIWLGAKISRFEHKSTLDDVTEFDLTGGDEIVGITISGGYYKIYTESGKVHLWDGTSNLLNESGTDLGFPVKKVYQISGIDYLVSGSPQITGALWYMNGLTPNLLFSAKNSAQINKWKFDIQTGQKTITNYKNKLFFIDNDGDNLKIASYGKDIQSLPNAYSIMTSYSSNGINIDGQLNTILRSSEYIYYGYYDGTTRGVDRVNITPAGTKQSSGYIVTNINDLQDLRKKQFTNLYLRVGDITATQYIEVYRSVDGGSYTLAHTINTQPEDGVARIPANLLQGAGGFRDYSLKFVFYTNGSTSPKLYNRYILEYETKGI